MTSTWPKEVPELTAEQQRISDDWMKYFHEIYSDSYGAVAKFNHTYPLRSARAGIRTLEIGAGLGEHLEFEDASEQEYVALELRPEMADVIVAQHPQAQTHVGDVEAGLDLPDGSFDRAIAIHVLEHLPNLPAALDEIRRVLRPGGIFEVVIPCEGGFGYGLGRRLTSQRKFERRYGVDYEPYIKLEHVNEPHEILPELAARFAISRRRFWPLRVPSVHVNLCIGVTCVRPGA